MADQDTHLVEHFDDDDDNNVHFDDGGYKWLYHIINVDCNDVFLWPIKVLTWLSPLMMRMVLNKQINDHFCL